MSTDVPGPESDVRMSLTEHLAELRTRLIRALLATAVGFGVAYFWAAELVARPDGWRVRILREGELALAPRCFGNRVEALAWAEARRREVAVWGVEGAATW